ncbi:hypothetical protein HOE39_00320 [Candidatus Woesearchaeota archaeon]|jgi:ribosomal protein S3AE|nr:hypothetical protein [Candidatus Woesearchaeota archaeon]
MAKKGKVTKLKTRKGKKKWFPVKAPKIYKSKDLPQVTAYEPAELVGRMIMINMKEITGSGRDSNTRAKFEIVKVQGDTAMTESRGFFVNDAQVSRVGRKAVTRIESVFYVNDKNGTKIKFKILLGSKNNISRVVQHEVRMLSEASIEKAVKKMDAESVFTVESIKKFSTEIKKLSKPIYPINDAIIWKASIV